MAEAAGSFTVCSVSHRAKDPYVNLLTPLRDSWMMWLTFVLCSESQHFTPRGVVLATKEAVLLGLCDERKSPGAF